MNSETRPGLRQTINEGANTLLGGMRSCDQIYKDMPSFVRAFKKVPDRVTETVFLLVAKATGGLAAENKNRLHNPQ